MNAVRERDALCALVAALAVTAGCGPGEEGMGLLLDGDPAKGKELTASFACGECHRIPGVTGASGSIGPPLEDWAARTYIAGRVLNTPDNLVGWIMDPQRVHPGTAMPDLGVDRSEATHIAAYLFSVD